MSKLNWTPKLNSTSEALQKKKKSIRGVTVNKF